MNFDDLDAKMRVYETAHDYCRRVTVDLELPMKADYDEFLRLRLAAAMA